MSRLKKIFAAVQTRNPDNASSTNKLEVTLGTYAPIEFIGSIPERGKVGLLMVGVDMDYENIEGSPVYLSINGNDPWSPHAAFLWGEVDIGGGDLRYIPLGISKSLVAGRPDPPKPWISQQVVEGEPNWISKWILKPMKSIHRFDGNRHYQTIVLYLKTADIENAGSSGPLEFTIYGKMWANSRIYHYTLYQTTLPKILKQSPTELGGHYLFSVYISLADFFKFDDVMIWQLTNKSNDAWMIEEMRLFFLDHNTPSYVYGRCASKIDTIHWVSLDPHDFNNSYRSIGIIPDQFL